MLERNAQHLLLVLPFRCGAFYNRQPPPYHPVGIYLFIYLLLQFGDWF